MTSPLVSIILPTYNGNPQRLSASIVSVLNQTYTHFELLIINDASTNTIEKTIQEFTDKDYRIRYLKNETNIWLTKTLNKALACANWTYIARQDDDDIWYSPEKLEKQVQFMENNQEYAVVWTWVITIDEEGKEIEKLLIRTTDKDIRNNILKSSQLAHWSVLIRKKALEKVWYYDPERNLVEDQELRMRIGIHYKLYNIPEYLFKYRINPNWVSLQKFNKQRRLWLLLLIKYIKYYPNRIEALFYKLAFFLLPYTRTKKILSRKNK